MMRWRPWVACVLLTAALWGCGEDESDTDSRVMDASLPDATPVDAEPADAMEDLVAACAAAIECAIDTPRQRDDCALEYGDTVDGRYQALLACAHCEIVGDEIEGRSARFFWRGVITATEEDDADQGEEEES